jgi:hypothetical protein
MVPDVPTSFPVILEPQESADPNLRRFGERARSALETLPVET